MKAIIAKIQKFFRTIKNRVLCLFSNDIKFTVDYTKTIKQALADCNLDAIDSVINDENFPTPPEMSGKKVEVVGRLFYDRGNSEDIIKVMDKKGFKPATLIELLAAQSKLQRRHPIVVLGSIWLSSRGNRQVPYFSVDGSDRFLALDYFDGDWDAECRFFGVPK